MKEFEKLREKILELKKETESQKRFIEKLKEEKIILSENCRYLIDKLNEIAEVYSEAGKKIIEDFGSQADSIKSQIAELDIRLKSNEKVMEFTKQEVLNLRKDFEKELKEVFFNTSPLINELEKVKLSLSEIKKEDVNESLKNLTKETENLKLELPKIFGEIDKIKTNFDVLREKITEKSFSDKDLASLKAEIDSLKEEQSKNSNKLLEVESIIKKVKELSNLEEILKTSFSEFNKKVGSQINEVEKRINSEISPLKLNFERFKEEMKSREQNFQETSKKFEENVNKILSEVFLQRENLSNLLEKVKEVDVRKVQEIERVVEGLKKGLKEIREEKKITEGEIEKLNDFVKKNILELRREEKRNLSNFETNLVLLKDKFHSLEEDVSKLNKIVSDKILKHPTILAVKSTIDELDTVIKMILKNMEDIRNNQKTSEANTEMINSRLDELKGRIDSLSDEVKNLKRFYEAELGRLVKKIGS